MRSTLVPLVLIAAIGCASGGRPASVAAPQIRTRVAGTIFFGSGSTAPVTLEVAITNRADVPIKIREVEVTSPGMAQYGIYTARRIFGEEIAPGQTRSLTLFTTAVTRVRNPTEPLTLRTMITIEAEGTRFREIALD
jgi:hypothetical protein